MFLPDNYYKMSLADQQKWWAANDPGMAFLASNQGGASAAAVNPVVAATNTGTTTAAGAGSKAATFLQGAQSAASPVLQAMQMKSQTKIQADAQAAQALRDKTLQAAQDIKDAKNNLQHADDVLDVAQNNLDSAAQNLKGMKASIGRNNELLNDHVDALTKAMQKKLSDDLYWRKYNGSTPITDGDSFNQAVQQELNNNSAYRTDINKLADNRQELQSVQRQYDKAQTQYNKDLAADQAAEAKVYGGDTSNGAENAGQNSGSNSGNSSQDLYQTAYANSGDLKSYLQSNGYQVSMGDDGLEYTTINGKDYALNDIKAAYENGEFKSTNVDFSQGKETLSGASSKLPAHAGVLKGFGGVTLDVGSAYGLAASVRDGSIAGAIASFGGLYAGMKMIGAAFKSSLDSAGNVMHGSFLSMFDKIPGFSKIDMWVTNHQLLTTLIVAAVIVAIALLTKKENEAEKQFADFNNMTVWSTGSVLTMASAAAFLTLGYNINTPSTSLNGANMTIPVSTLKSALASGLSNADGSAYSGDVPYNTPIVLKGQAPGGGDQVILINQAGIKNGKAIDALQVYNLSNNMTFSKPTTTTAGTAQAVGGYIPFFVNGKVNPQAVTATNSQSGLLAGTGAMSASGQAGAVAVAGAMNKAGVTVNTVGQ